jgi:hypothetical protein
MPAPSRGRRPRATGAGDRRARPRLDPAFVVEARRDAAPAGVAQQCAAFAGARRPGFALDRAERVDGRNVGLELGGLAFDVGEGFVVPCRPLDQLRGVGRGGHGGAPCLGDLHFHDRLNIDRSGRGLRSFSEQVGVCRQLRRRSPARKGCSHPGWMGTCDLRDVERAHAPLGSVSSRWEGVRGPLRRHAVVRRPAGLPERQRADANGSGVRCGRLSGGHRKDSPPEEAAAGQGPARIYVRVTTANAGCAGTPQRAAVAGSHEANRVWNKGAGRERHRAALAHVHRA